MKLKKLLHKERWRFSSEARKVDTLCSWAGSEPWRMWGGRATNLSRQPDVCYWPGPIRGDCNVGVETLSQRHKRTRGPTRTYELWLSIVSLDIDCCNTQQWSAQYRKERHRQFWTDNKLWTCFDIWHLTVDNIQICLKKSNQAKDHLYAI